MINQHRMETGAIALLAVGTFAAAFIFLLSGGGAPAAGSGIEPVAAVKSKSLAAPTLSTPPTMKKPKVKSKSTTTATVAAPKTTSAPATSSPSTPSSPSPQKKSSGGGDSGPIYTDPGVLK